MADKAAQAPKDRAAWVEQSFRDSKQSPEVSQNQNGTHCSQQA